MSSTGSTRSYGAPSVSRMTATDTAGGPSSGGARRAGALHRRRQYGSVKKRLARLEMTMPIPERKYVLTNPTGGAAYLVDDQPVVTLLNPLTRGDTVQNRDGDKIRVKQVYLQYKIQTGGGTDFHTQAWRVMVVVDMENNAQLLNTTTLMGSAAPSTIALYNFNNYDWFKRFKVLYDKSGGWTTTGDSAIWCDTLNWKGDFTADYAGGNTGDYTDLRSGAIYLIYWGGNDSQAWSGAPYFLFSSKIGFTDA